MRTEADGAAAAAKALGVTRQHSTHMRSGGSTRCQGTTPTEEACGLDVPPYRWLSPHLPLYLPPCRRGIGRFEARLLRGSPRWLSPHLPPRSLCGGRPRLAARPAGYHPPTTSVAPVGSGGIYSGVGRRTRTADWLCMHAVRTPGADARRPHRRHPPARQKLPRTRPSATALLLRGLARRRGALRAWRAGWSGPRRWRGAALAAWPH